MGEGATTANQFLWPVIYVWRPGVGRVGFIFDAAAGAGTELPATPAIASKTFSGSAITVQAGDVLVLEVWYSGTSGGAANLTQTLRVTSNPDTKLTSPYTILFEPNPKIETLKEDFEAPLDTAKWLTDTVSGTVTFSGGTGNFNYTSTVNGTHAGLESQGEYDFAGSSAFVKIADAPWWGAGNPAGGEFSFSIESANTNRIDWTIYSTGNLSLIKFTNNTWGQIAEIEANFRPVKDNYAWLRFRESGGTIYFEAAPITASDPPLPGEWVVKYSGTVVSLPITLASAKVTFRVWISNATAGYANPMPKIDALNGPTTSGPTSVATLAATEEADTVAATVSVVTPPRTANLAVTEAADTVAGVVKSTATANLDVTEAKDTSASAVKVGAPANLSVTEAPDTLASTVSAPFPLIETFTENFEAPLDTAKWNPVVVNGTIDFVGGVGVQTLTSAAVANQASLISNGFYNFIGSSLFYKFVQPIRTAGNVVGLENGFGVRTPANGRTIQWWLEADGVLKAVKQDQFVQTVFAIVEPNYYANPLPYTWLRIRESGGTVYFDSAPDTASNPPIEADWVNRASAATATINGPWTQAQVNSYIYMQGAAAGVPIQPLKIDGINTAANGPTISTGDLSITEAKDVVAATATAGWPVLNASLSVTEANDTVASTALIGRDATLAVTEAADALSATVKSTAGATAILTEAPDSIASTATVSRAASASMTEANDTVASTVVTVIGASLSVTEANDSVASTGTVAWPAITANLNVTEAADTSAATVSVVTPTILYFGSTGSFTSPTAGDKSTYMPQGSNFASGVAESYWTLVRPVDGNGTTLLANIPPGATGVASMYFSRFSSDPLIAQTIPAQTWAYRPKVQGNARMNVRHVPVMYVWRPSTSAVVGYILDATGAQGNIWSTTAGQDVNDFAGASVTTQAGDILVIEAWGIGQDPTGNGSGVTWYRNSNIGFVSSPYPILFSGAVLAADLTRTEADDTLVSTVSTTIGAAAAMTEAPDSLATDVDVVAKASAGITEASDTLAATVKGIAGAALSATEAGDSIAATARGIAGATLVVTEAGDTLSSAGVVVPIITATLSVTEAPDTVSATAALANPIRVADLSVTEAKDTLGSTATAAWPPSAGSLSVTEAKDTLSSIASVSAFGEVTANLAVTEAPDTALGYTVKPRKRAILIT
jgi:hypothetical protein